MAGEVHLLTHEFQPFRGGIGVYVEETARALAALGAKPVVWAPDYGRHQADGLPFPVQRVAMRGKQDWLCRLKMAKALRGFFPDGRLSGTVVLAEPGPIRLWMYRKLLRLPQPGRLVIILHGSEVSKLCGRGHRRKLFRRLLRQADAIGVVSGAVEKSVMACCPEVEPVLVRVPGAVRSCWTALPPLDRPAHGGPVEILQVGRFHPRKGQLQLVDALNCLPRESLSRIRVRLIGPAGRPGYMQAVEKRIRECQLPVSLEGPLSEAALRGAYETATLLVMPSQPCGHSIEGLGLTLLEAQHFGCPVVGSNIGGIPEALLDRESGQLVPPGDATALAAAIQSFLDHPQQADRMGRAGAQFVRSHFCWQRNVRQLGLV